MIWKILITLLISGLNFTRGYHWRPLSIAFMSIIMGLYFAITIKIWWLLFAVGVPMGICLGLHDHNRGVWCSIVALGASITLLLTGNLAWYWFAIYCAGNFGLGWLMVNKLKAKQLLTDLVTGVGFGGLVWLL